jgi:2-amino-4-hydroxy-6-hydroxymethyldihydropteridine diphosphokinase
LVPNSVAKASRLCSSRRAFDSVWLYDRVLTRDDATTLAYIALGSNIEPRREHIDAAIAALRSIPGVESIRLSPIVETDPVGPGVQGKYLNAAAELRTTLSARELLACCFEIEKTRGRDRAKEQRWGARTLDLDLLLFGDAILNEPGLTVPHPRLHERRFVLEPLSKLAPQLVIPGLGTTVSECLGELPD